jgi:hypothetical protein
MSSKRYKIKVDRRTTYTVLEHQLYKPRWVSYFGSIEEVDKFIKEYK